jgi:predicted dehydrogenase
MLRSASIVLALLAITSLSPAQTSGPKPRAVPMVKLINVDPGHHHASLVQRQMYDQVDPVVHVYAPGGEDLDGYTKRVEGFNSRPDHPTHWVQKVYAGPDFFERMLRERPGNLVILAGNNTRKTQYILGCVKAGLNVLADKPMAINPAQYELLVEAFKVAEEQGVLLYDIMTERYEITTILQRELSMMPEVFGELEKGTPEQPAVTKESVHHFSKQVAGKPLIRPAWFFDVRQEGEGLTDVATHLVDLVQWECFPEQTLSTQDVKLLLARRSSTPVTPAQFKQVTALDEYPEFLKQDVQDGVLQVYGNGEILYTLRGHVAKVSVRWNFESPGGGGDTHYSIMRGTKANLIIEQGQAQNYKPMLYVENKSGTPDQAFESALGAAVGRVTAKYPGVTLKKGSNNWEIVVPETLRANHEQHFGQVTDKFLGFLAQGHMPRWEAPNMIVKYYTTIEAYKASR